MAGISLSRRGFLGHLGGAAATAVVVPAMTMTLNERKQKLQDDLGALLMEMYPGAKIVRVDEFPEMFMVRAVV